MSENNPISFVNEQLSTSALPQVETLVFQPLEQKYKTVLILGRMIYTFITAFIVGVVMMFSPLKEMVPDWAIYVFMLLYFLYVLWGFLKTVKGFAHKSYALRQRDIIYRSGWLWKHMTTTPFNRVQHVSIDQGPIERNFNLAKLRIFTAGGKSSDISIPGLSPETADQLKEFIVAKTLEDKAGPSTTIAEDEEQ